MHTPRNTLQIMPAPLSRVPVCGYYRKRGLSIVRWMPALLVAAMAFGAPVMARDTIVGHSTGASSGSSGAAATSQTATAATQATAQAAEIAVLKKRAQDSMLRSAATLQSMQSAQAAARAAALAGPNHLVGTTDIPDGIAVNGLNPLGGATAATVQSGGPGVVQYNIPVGSNAWTNVGALTQSTANGATTVTVTQNAPEALLKWDTFNISKNTVLDFDQSAGGSNASSWVAINQVLGASASPSQILGQINAPGQVYVINQNGIIFGGSSQVNVHTLAASSLPINTNLISPELLLGGASTEDQFLFSQLTITKVNGVTNALPTFTPPTAPAGGDGDVVVQAGAQLSSPTNASHVGGRIALIGPVVDNEGTISTPDGQTILAAGLQVGFTAHAQSDPSLRGLDVFVGGVTDSNGLAQNVNGVAFGTVTNGGMLESPRADITMEGMNVNQNGVIDSLTSVALNGRIDLLADYGANPIIQSINGVNQAIFGPSQTGAVNFGSNSLTQILPDTSSSTVVGTSLALSSMVNVEGFTIHMASGAELWAPGAMAVAPTSSTVGSVDLAGAPLTSGVNFDTGNWILGGATPVLSASTGQGGQVTIDSGAIVDVSGAQDVAASVSENIVAVQLRGSELADSPLQQDGPLRGTTVDVDIRDSGVYNGVAWIGSPIGDLSGYAGLVQHTAAELSVNGGTVNIQAGGGVNLAAGSTINVSGGWIDYAGANVQTTKVVTADGRVLDISQATPNQFYQGLYTGFNVTSPKWGTSQTFQNSLPTSLTTYDPGYVQGGNGGALTLSTPTVTMKGNLYGNTVAGINQLSPVKAAGLSEFQGATFLGSDFTSILLPIFAVPQSSALVLNLLPENAGQSPAIAPQDVVFQNSTGAPKPDPFASSGNPELDISTDLIGVDGFSRLTIDGGNSALSSNYNNTATGVQADVMQGNISVPAGVVLTTQAGGAITLASINMDIEGSVIVPNGSLSFFTQNVEVTDPTSPLAPVAGRGNFTLGNDAMLSTAGLIENNMGSSPSANLLPAYVDGGSITIKSLNVDLQTGTTIDVSGGVVVNASGKATYGAGGSIDIEAGQDPYTDSAKNYGIIGGQLYLGSTLNGFSGKTGGSLSILAPAIQIGGAALQNGDTSTNPMVQQNNFVWGNGTTLWLDRSGSPDFFSQGGFSSFSMTGLGLAPVTYDSSTGLAISENPYASTPGVLIAAGTTLQPVVQSYMETMDANGVSLTPTTYQLASQRNPVNLAFNASGVKATASTIGSANALVVRGDLVLGTGATIETDPLGSVTLKGQSVAVLGKVYAPGGSINVTGAADSTNLYHADLNGFDSLSDIVATVDLAPGSVLSTAGVAEMTYNQFGYNTGNLLNGGKISVSGNIVAEANSLVDVSGASATLDVLPASADITTPTLSSQRMVPTSEASNGGSISFNGGEELFVDSTLVGRAGAPGAGAGSLTISNGFSNVSLTNPGIIPVQTMQDATLIVTSGGSSRMNSNLTGLAVLGQMVMPNSPMTDVDGNAILGYFGANTNIFATGGASSALSNNGGIAGGIGSLTLNASVQFSGPVSIATSSSLIVANNPNFSQASFPISGGVIYADNSVTLNSAYVRLGLPFAGPGASAISNPVTSGAGVLTVNASGLIDVGDLSLENVGQLNLNSAGDVRGDGSLNVAGNISITAAQIYPTTDSAFTITAFNPAGGTSTVTLAKPSGNLPALPLSAGGVLSIYADTIVQGGVLRAPMGTINLGSNSFAPASVSGAPTTTQITLSAGSVTSVSAIDPTTGLGIIIPYGSIDNSGNWIDPSGATITAGSTPTLPAKAINIAGADINDLSGATIDIRGGGDLSASQFVSGVGGTKDILNSTSSFAILPSLDQSSYAPFDIVSGYSTSSYSGLQVGDQVYLAGGNGFAAGYYTLLPSSYAHLPGAFLVTPQIASSSSTTQHGAYSGGQVQVSNVPTGVTVALPTGGSLVSGYRVNSLASTREQSLTTLFEVDSQAVINAGADYVTSYANTYFAQSAASLGVITPRLPVDSGQLVFKATKDLTLPNSQGALLAQAGVNGLGGIVDIASPSDINIYNSSNPLTPAIAGDLNLDSSGLTALNAGSLFIGGYRDSAGTSAIVTTNNLIVNNQGDTGLAAADLILASNGSLQVMDGSVISASAGTNSALPLQIQNNNAITIASSTTSSPVVTLASAPPANLAVGSSLLGSTVTAINGMTVTLAANANASVSNATETFSSSDGALLRVSNASTNPISRPDGINLADSAPNLVIGKNVTINGTSLAMDSTGKSGSIDSSAIFNVSDSVSISSGQLSLVLDNSQTATGLVLSGGALATLQASVKSLSLLSYSSIDIWGSGDIGAAADSSGHFEVQNLALHAAEIRGFNTGGQAVNINAQNVSLDNSANGQAPGPATGSSNVGTLAINSDALTLGINPLAIDQYAQVTLSASKNIVLNNGTGSLSAAANLTLSTPLITAAPITPLTPLQELNGQTASTVTNQTISAAGALNIDNDGGTASSTTVEGLGSKLTLAGASVSTNTTIQLPSGSLAIVATTGNLTVGGNLDLRGTKQNIYSLTEYTSGGQVSLTSYLGDVTLSAGSIVNVSAQAGGGNAGSLSVSASNGLFAFDGSSMLGQGGAGGLGGIFSLDAANLTSSSLSPLEAALNPTVSGAISGDTYLGGFTQAQTIRLRTGDIVVDGVTATDAFNLSADNGSITVSGKVISNSGQTDASGASTASIDVTTQPNSNGVNVLSNPGVTGGSIDLEANGSVTLVANSLLSVAAQTVDDAGKGGAVTLEAGSETNGVEPSTSQARDGTTGRFTGAPVVDIQTGSAIDLSVVSTTKTFDGSKIIGATGTLHLRAPQTTSSTDLQIDPLDGSILNASSIVVEGYKVFNATDGSIDNQEAAVNANGKTFAGVAGQPASASYSAMLAALTSANSSLQSVMLIEPGAEIINTNGDLTLARNWDLSTYRYGPNSVAGDLTLRASGNIVLDFGASLSDGFTKNTNASLAAFGLWSDVLMAAGSQSWSYRLVAGSDFDAAGHDQVLPSSQSSSLFANNPSALAVNSGSLLVGLGTPDLPNNSNLTTAKIMSTANGGLGFYQTIRTGVGSIDIASGGDVQLLNDVATIYTAGTQSAALTGFDVPNLINPRVTGNSNYNYTTSVITAAQYSQNGGNLTIDAQGSISHYTLYDPSAGLPIVGYDINGNPLMDASSLELPTDWLMRRGYSVANTTGAGNVFATDSNHQVASTSWWVDFNNFFEGVGTLGGGNVTLTAGQNINNIDAVVPTNARMPGKDASGNLIAANALNMVEMGGGDLRVQAGGNINGGVYYVERGEGTLDAGNQITTNATRTVAIDSPVTPATYLPTTLFLGKGDFDLSAGGDLSLGPVVNPFLLPQGINNTDNDKSYFSTYASTDTVTASSLTGNVTVKDASSVDSLLMDFYTDKISSNGSTDFASSFPWLGLVETDPTAFTSQIRLMPPTLSITAFSADIDVQGDVTLSPSPTGNLNFVAAGSINAFQPDLVNVAGVATWASSQINLSDADPNNIPGIVTPLSYVANPSLKITLANTDANLFTTFNSLFNVSGSTDGIYSQLTTQQALHADIPIDPSDPNSALGPLHANDSTPLHLYAATGDIDGVNLFSGKEVNVVAGNDISNVSFYVQNVNPTDISLIEAGNDITAYDKNSILRQETHRTGGVYFGEDDDSTSSSFAPDGVLVGAPNAGDIQIAGPGTLEVLAGRNLALGDGPNNGDGTGLGLISIGNTVDPSLSFNGADIIAAGGLGGSSQLVANAGSAGFGLDGAHNSTLDFSDSTGTGFTDLFLNPTTGGATASQYLPILGSLMGLTNVSNAQIWSTFSSLPVENQDALALNIYYDVLRDAGRDHNNPLSPNAGTYAEGYKAQAALFNPSHTYQGSISLTAREIKTTNNGDISLLSPGGGIDVGLNNNGTQALDQGILTVDGGNISIFSEGSLNVGTSRIFTLHGGNEIIWSTLGNIAAGASSKTVQSAPPTRVLVDTTSGNVETDLAGLATGGGIGVLETIAGAPPGDVDLVAPSGIVDAGDAGIRSSGNINIAATQVLNAGNIQSGGSTSGVAAPVSANIGAAVAASSAAGASQNAATSAAQQQQHNETQPEDIPSIISVTVIGYGGGDDD